MHAALGVLLAAALAPQARPAGAAQPRSEEYEFIQTETGYVLPERIFEADLTIQHLEFDDDDFEFTAQALVAELAYGITDWAMIEARVPFRRFDVDGDGSESGIGDLEFEGKVALTGKSSPVGLIPDEVGVALAGGLRISVPTGDEDEGLGRENASFAPFVSASYWFDPRIGVHGKVEGELQQDFKPQWRATAAIEFMPWDPSFSLFGALDFRRDGSESNGVTVAPGAAYRFPGMPLAIGVGFPLGLNDEAPDYGVIVNGEFRF